MKACIKTPSRYPQDLTGHWKDAKRRKRYKFTQSKDHKSPASSQTNISAEVIAKCQERPASINSAKQLRDEVSKG